MWGPVTAPLIAVSDVCIMDARDKNLLQKTNAQSLDDMVELYSDSDLLDSDIESMTKKALQRLARSTQRLWLHIDLDVLSTASLLAADYQKPGGLSWEQLEALARAVMSFGRVAGCNVTIYNPDMDPDGHFVRRIVRFLAQCWRRRADVWRQNF